MIQDESKLRIYFGNQGETECQSSLVNDGVGVNVFL